jgi:nitrite reductase/ring-hydroxylating ferredoxin subunit
MGAHEEHATGILRTALDPERATPIETPWGKFALHLVEEEVVCVQAFCPHMEGPLFEGTCSGKRIVCPWHGWVYDLSSCKRVDLGGGSRSRLERLSVTDRGAEGLILQKVDSSED